MAKKFSLSKIGQINLNVKDIEKAVGFYQETLGMSLMFKVDKLAFFNCDGVRLMISEPETQEFNSPGSVIYFSVSNIRDYYDHLFGKGVTFNDEPHLIADMGDQELWMAFFQDYDQNTLALMSEIPKR